MLACLWRGSRPATLILTLGPFALGALAGMRGSPQWLVLLIALTAALALHAAANLINDAFDAQTGADDLAARLPGSLLTGPGLLISGVCSAGQVRAASIGLPGIALMCAAALTLLGVSPASLLIVAGVALAYAYTGPPASLAYRGHGLAEIAAVAGYGLLPAALGYASQAGEITARALLTGLPHGVLAAVLLLIHDSLHPEADRLAGKHTPVVAYGDRAAWWMLGALIAAVYAALAAAVMLGALPAWALIATITALPVAWAWRRLRPPTTPAAALTAIQFASQTHLLITGIAGLALALV